LCGDPRPGTCVIEGSHTFLIGNRRGNFYFSAHPLFSSTAVLKKILCLLAFLAPAGLHGGDSPRVVRAVRISTPPKMDGFLEEKVWKGAEPASDFIQREPDEGRPASECTEIRVLYDDDALYFGCMFYDAEPEKIVARLTRRDNEIESDNASIRIDSYHDNQTNYEFTFNAAGVKVDILQYDDADKEDASWDAVWELETRILPNGWSAEVKIPFRILRYQKTTDASLEQEWGINFIRTISRKQESARWAFTPKSESGFTSRFGHLRGLRDLPTPRQIGFLPFAVARQRFEPAQTSRARVRELRGDAGLDLRYSLSNNFTLDATFNPDFGQVEADPAVLNLTTFETFYPEKRPFFIEGTQVLRFTTFGGTLGPGIFYSRRIGRAIASSEVRVPPGGTIDDLPQSTTILGAAKVNGKTNSGLSIGILQAFTQEEKAMVVDSNGAKNKQVVEPFAHFNIIRLKQDILSNSNVGMILTSVEKENRLPAIVNGWDWNIKLDNSTYLFEGFFAHTHASNTSLERIRGWAGRFNFARIAAEHWLWSVGGRIASREYNINDAGFFFRPDGWTGLAQLSYKEDRPATVARNFSIGLVLTEFHNLDGISLQREARLNGSLLFSNYWSASMSFASDFGLYDDRETRGNGLYRRAMTYAANASLFSDSRGEVTGRIGQLFGWDSKRKYQSATEGGLTIKPLSWMEWDVSSRFEIVRDQEAWVSNLAGTTGVQSIFGDRSTDSFDFTLRSTITFTRELTLQVYGQVFVAKGHFVDFRSLVAPSEFVPVTFLFRDFNTRSLNSNVVLRWEYLPGSTIYLVWTQARSGFDEDYFTSFTKNITNSFKLPADNVFLVKITYWWSL